MYRTAASFISKAALSVSREAVEPGGLVSALFRDGAFPLHPASIAANIELISKPIIIFLIAH